MDGRDFKTGRERIFFFFFFEDKSVRVYREIFHKAVVGQKRSLKNRASEKKCESEKPFVSFGPRGVPSRCGN